MTKMDMKMKIYRRPSEQQGPTHNNPTASSLRSVCTLARYPPASDTTRLHWCRNRTCISIRPLPLELCEPGSDCPLSDTKLYYCTCYVCYTHRPYNSNIPLCPVITQPMRGVSLNMLVTVEESRSLSCKMRKCYSLDTHPVITHTMTYYYRFTLYSSRSKLHYRCDLL